jgi:hypothetical protein
MVIREKVPPIRRIGFPTPSRNAGVAGRSFKGRALAVRVYAGTLGVGMET